MRGKRRRLVRNGSLASLVAVAFAAFALASAAPASAGTLDQSQPEFTPAEGFTVHSGQTMAQTFTAELSGALDQVDLALSLPGCPPTEDLNVEIRTVSGGLPTSTVLASETVPKESISTTKAFIPIVFSSPATVAAGTQYAIVLSSEESTCFFSVGYAENDPYPRGSASFKPPDVGFEEIPGDDLAFKTYVVVAAPGPPTPPTANCAGKATTHVGTTGNDVITGTPGPDVILGLGGDDTISGVDGDDVICAGPGNDTATGGRGEDNVNGQSGNDRLNGSASKDKLKGKAGNDVLKGGPAKDTLKGGTGKDKLFGQGATDNLSGQGGRDTCIGGAGDDGAKSCEKQKSI